MENTLFINNKDLKFSTSVSPPEPSICFQGANQKEIIKLDNNGNIFVHGNLIENDKKLVDGLREFLSSHGTYWKKKHDELGKEWAFYTDEWQKTIEMLEEESLEKDKKIRELQGNNTAYINIWTSTQGLKNMINNKQFIGYSEKSKMNIIKITVPITAIMTFESLDRTGDVQYVCFQKELWA